MPPAQHLLVDPPYGFGGQDFEAGIGAPGVLRRILDVGNQVRQRGVPPRGDDLEIGWQLPPQMWGRGYASESSRAIADWAFEQGLEELFAVVRPNNTRAAAVAHRNGMEWVGETDKYFGMTLQVYRLRPVPDDPAGSAPLTK